MHPADGALLDGSLRARALQLTHGWASWLETQSGDRPQLPVRDLVVRSWERTRALGVDPEQGQAPEPLAVDEVERRRRASGLEPVVGVLRASLTAGAGEAQQVMIITDPDAVVLWREASNPVKHRADRLGFTIGARWSERSVGTNAIGTALADDAPTQLFAAEHFVKSHHAWTCAASPVRDPHTGTLLGIVNVSGPAATFHPMTMALVSTAARLAESTLWCAHEQRLTALRQVAAPILARIDGPGLVVDDEGWVAAVSGMPPRDRVAAPEAGQPMALGGIGACWPEPVPGGWLLRAGTGLDRSVVRLRLANDGQRARLHVTTVGPRGELRWEQAISPRHVDIVTALGRHPEGLDAAGLADAVYGDATRVVTVRAEVARLRRVLGGLMLARPYRFAPQVALDPAD
ncbi:MAG: GAF domain-containing protein [Intrasporangium sp.]|uniref:GAF domain-containing protein n=1 Tax=Intrasporangium sp. TaxID=1925024 RepID=UPI0026480BB1|nr:GAF domain-containing protein [Intrasporangium sp.]MDN5796889.1 GAF domain-containing protein [Intrasporangium sp.]